VLGLRIEVSSIALRRDFLFSFGLVAVSEGNFSVVAGDAISPRSVDGRALIDLALRVAFAERFVPEAS
jgi:hypothetical protein